MKNQTSLPYKASYLDNKNVKVIAKSFATKEEALAFLPDPKMEENNIIEIEVNKYLKLAPSLQTKLKGYRKGVDFPYQHVDMDPYIIGLWLGDGGSRDPVITNQDATILKYLKHALNKYDLQLVYQSGYTYRISSYTGKPNANAFWNAMKKYNLQENKHIPHEYKCNAREVRMSLLAGIIDSDGYYCKKGKLFSISQKSNVLTEDILYLARSLGFAAYSSKVNKSCTYKGEKKTNVYNSITISGNGLEEIPNLVKRKQAEKRKQIKDTLSTGIKVEHVGRDNYYGFTLDGNNRYLMGDFTVTHNTCSAIATASSSFEQKGYTMLWVTRTTLKSDIWKNMFDQICSQTIQEQMQNGEIDVDKATHTKRMRMLSNAWSIRPMSYKQFSNMILKSNALYKALIKKNGEVDPLRKTLLIIDEAHKLYGGTDLSSIERPDMKVLENAIQQSYEISGLDSVKVLLMTATPITQDPMELIKLINLAKPSKYQMPAEFDAFAEKFLDEHGRFTPEGEKKYLDAIAGHVSYLNREKDARQFAQPIIKYVKTPLLDIDDAMRYDTGYTRAIMDSEIMHIREKIDEENKKIDDEIKELKASDFEHLKEKCESFDEGKPQKMCNKIVKENIRELVKNVKESVKEVKAAVNELKEQISFKRDMKKEFIENIQKNVENESAHYENYKESLYYSIRKCGKKITNMDELRAAVKDHPAILAFDEQLREVDENISKMEQNLQNTLASYKKRMTDLKKLAKEDLSQLEKNVVNLVIKDERKTMKKRSAELEKEHAENVGAVNKTRKSIEKKKRKKLMGIRKTMREMVRDEKRTTKEIAKEERRLRRTQRQQKSLVGNFKNKFIDEMENKYSKIIDEQLQELVSVVKKMQDDESDKQAEKERKAAEKIAEKERKEIENKNKEAAKIAEKERKEIEKQRKEVEKIAEKERKVAEKHAMKETRRIEKEKKNATKKKR